MRSGQNSQANKTTEKDEQYHSPGKIVLTPKTPKEEQAKILKELAEDIEVTLERIGSKPKHVKKGNKSVA